MYEYICMCEYVHGKLEVVLSATGHMVVAGIYNHLLPLPILYSVCHQLAPQLFMVLT